MIDLFLVWLTVYLVPVILVVYTMQLAHLLFTSTIISAQPTKILFYITAAIGVPIHELSHAIMAMIFGHKVEHIALFEYNDIHGRLGYVSHSWNKRNALHNFGHFFIGFAPLLGGALIIWGLTILLLPNASLSFLFSAFSPLEPSIGALDYIIMSSVELVIEFGLSMASTTQFWLWLFLSSVVAFFSIPSIADLRHVWRGAVMLAIFTVFSTILGQEFVDVELFLTELAQDTLVCSVFYLMLASFTLIFLFFIYLIVMLINVLATSFLAQRKDKKMPDPDD